MHHKFRRSQMFMAPDKIHDHAGSPIRLEANFALSQSCHGCLHRRLLAHSSLPRRSAMGGSIRDFLLIHGSATASPWSKSFGCLRFTHWRPACGRSCRRHWRGGMFPHTPEVFSRPSMWAMPFVPEHPATAHRSGRLHDEAILREELLVALQVEM